MRHFHYPQKVVRGGAQGFALVVVLAIVVLLVALIIGFMSRATTEQAASSGNRSAIAARQIADSAVSLVQGQINNASTQGSDVAWASQPGMVRTFSGSGGLLKAYKLYSADKMVSTAVSLTDDVPTTAAVWSDSPAVWTDLNSPVSGNYPIIDPTANSEGFTNGAGALVASYSGANPLPLPVRWLYVLKDGSMVAPGVSGRNASVAGASANNPIVGRVAFWTDDETCKVNINTASEGTYWDYPRGATITEAALGRNQPVQKEYQRYSGHPAMTSLSAVFPALSANQIYAMVPRVNGGGSNGGSTPYSSAAQITPDTDRLYASVDELAFASPSSGDSSRSPNTMVDKTAIERAKFFITAHSEAPETNLFNLPRVAIWPIASQWGSNPSSSNGEGISRTSPFDRLIAFCSTINGEPYYFQRKNYNSSTEDINLTRNEELYSYLQALTAKPFPGFGGNFSTKYGADRDQILTEIFDYIRSANLSDPTVNIRYTPDYQSDGDMIAGHGQVAPTVKGTTMGFGRTHTLSEVAIAFICTGDHSTNPTGLPGTSDISVRAIIIPEFFSPMLGYTGLRPDMKVSISVETSGSLPHFTYGNKQLTFSPGTLDLDLNAAKFGGASFGGEGLSYLYALWERTGTGAPGKKALYPYISNEIIIKDSDLLDPTKPTDRRVKFIGGIVTITIQTGQGTQQTFKVTMPDTSLGSGFPIPKPFLPEAPQWRDFAWRIENTLNGTESQRIMFNPNDDAVIRSIAPFHGDYRLIAAQENIADLTGSIFMPHPNYQGSKEVAANLTRDRVNPAMPPPQKLERDSRYFLNDIPFASTPDIQPNRFGIAANIPETTGDFDTGMAYNPDGAYINKPDEGNTDSEHDAPYFGAPHRSLALQSAFFSPNRQMPSAGMFGSLPTGVKAGVPWKTLLFRPQAGHPSHSTTIPDHLMLDLFWMPVVEPYAISDRFSTAGKINLNYQIMPFNYVTRSTGINALLKSEKVAAIPNNASVNYKTYGTNLDIRRPINIPETLKQFTTKFSGGDIFISASQICDLHIVPTVDFGTAPTASTMASYWSNNKLTGDNLRERIYTTLYPRLTTKSNTYTVHFRAQALKKVPTTAVGTWVEGTDKVMGEYRGSTTIERFIDASNTSIPDYASQPTATPTLDAFYKWRVISNKQFAP